MKETDSIYLLGETRALNTPDELLARFMTESNAIEGEDGLNPGDIEAAAVFIKGPLSEWSLLACHAKLGEHLKVDWAGRYRDCGVRVEHVAPPHEQVPDLMRAYFKALPKLDSWEAHNRFQKIHPFRDLNGRTGRMIRLHKEIRKGHTGRIGFLHRFTLSNATAREMTERPYDHAPETGSLDFRPDDGITVANWKNSVLARRDDVTGFVNWVKAKADLDEPVKKLVSALATEFNRERGR